MDRLEGAEVTNKTRQTNASLRLKLQGFEERYHMSSNEFYHRFRAGELGDAVDFVE
jgi:hypothetical protein